MSVVKFMCSNLTSVLVTDMAVEVLAYHEQRPVFYPEHSMTQNQVDQACHPRTLAANAGRSQVQGHPQLQKQL